MRWAVVVVTKASVGVMGFVDVVSTATGDLRLKLPQGRYSLSRTCTAAAPSPPACPVRPAPPLHLHCSCHPIVCAIAAPSQLRRRYQVRIRTYQQEKACAPIRTQADLPRSFSSKLTISVLLIHFLPRFLASRYSAITYPEVLHREDPVIAGSSQMAHQPRLRPRAIFKTCRSKTRTSWFCTLPHLAVASHRGQVFFKSSLTTEV